jgi:hypothetical protein
MYIAIGTRPDIAYAVGCLASFLDCYRPEHWEAAIRVLHYLKGICTLALKLGSSNPLRLVSYSDSDYANCPDTSHSIGGYCFSLGSGMISWGSRKQHTVRYQRALGLERRNRPVSPATRLQPSPNMPDDLPDTSTPQDSSSTTIPHGDRLLSPLFSFFMDW